MYKVELVDGRVPFEKIQEFLNDHALQVLRFKKLDSYYKGANAGIFARKPPEGHSGPWNQIPVPRGRLLITVATGFMYKPGLIRYELSDVEGDEEGNAGKQEYYDLLMSALRDNGEPELNAELGRDQALFGQALELHYIGDNPDAPQFAKVSPMEAFPIYSAELKRRMVAAVRTYVLSGVTYLHVYYQDAELQYLKEESEWKLIMEKPLPFTQVPLVVFRNNEEAMGDLESIIPLLDAFDLLISSGLNEEEKFAEAILLIYGKKINAETILKLKQLRVIDDLDPEAEIKYLTKQAAGQDRKELFEILRKEIHANAMIPDLTDNESIGQKSGEAMIYLFALFELLAGIKEAYFSQGIKKRMQLVTESLSMGKQTNIGDPVWINSVWSRNLPKNVLQAAEIVANLNGIVSKETLLAQVPFVEDPKAEMDRLRKEKDVFMEDVPLPDEPTSESADLTPVEGGSVQDQALNGAQITAIIELAEKVKSGLLTKESAIAIVEAAIPGISPEKSHLMISGGKSVA